MSTVAQSVSKRNRLQVKTVKGWMIMEILRVSRSLGVDARDIALAEYPAYETEHFWWGINRFWKEVNEGRIIILPE